MGTSIDETNNGTNTNSTIPSTERSKDSITLKKATFYKIVIIGIIALMVSAFFAGYNLRGMTSPVTYVTIPSTFPSLQNGAISSSASSNLPAPIPVSVKNITLGDAPFLGKSDAKTAFIEYGDFQCPFCETFFSNALSQIKGNYVDTGKLKFVYKQFPLDIHPNAKVAAIAAECAKEQGKFWPYHDALFGNQSSWGNTSGNQTAADFVKYATDLGLNSNNFKACFDAKKYEDKINKDLTQGSILGVTGTPTFFVGNDEKNYTSIEGAQPFTSFQRIIDQKLQ